MARQSNIEDEERGAVAGEYAVLLAILAIALVTVIALFTDGLVRAFDAAIAVLP
jgi:Flp pilus assembly pilin Flp